MRRFRKLVVAAIVSGVGIAGGAAFAAIPGSGGVINGCYSTKNGALSVVDSAAKCPNGTSSITWNQTGPQGPAGPAGPTGPTGPQGPAGPSSVNWTQMVSPVGLPVSGPLISVNEPGPNAVSQATVWLLNNSTTTTYNVWCQLVMGGSSPTTDTKEVTLPPGNGTTAGNAEVTLLGSAFSTAGSVSQVTCGTKDTIVAPRDLAAQWVALSSQAVGSLTQS